MYTPRESKARGAQLAAAASQATSTLLKESVLVSLNLRRFSVSPDFVEAFSLQQHSDSITSCVSLVGSSSSSSAGTGRNSGVTSIATTTTYTLVVSRANKSSTALANERWRHKTVAKVEHDRGSISLNFESDDKMKFVLPPEVVFNETLLDRILLLEVYENQGDGPDSTSERSLAFATVDPSTFIGKPPKDYSIKFSATHRRCRENPSRQQDAGKLAVEISVLPASSKEASHEVITFKRVTLRIDRVAVMSAAAAAQTLQQKSSAWGRDATKGDFTHKGPDGGQRLIEPGFSYQLRVKYCGNTFSTPYRPAKATFDVQWGTTLAFDIFPDDGISESSPPPFSTPSSSSDGSKVKFSIWKDDDERCGTFAVGIERLAGSRPPLEGVGEVERAIRLPFRFDKSRGFDSNALAELFVVSYTHTTTTLRKHILRTETPRRGVERDSSNSTLAAPKAEESAPVRKKKDVPPIRGGGHNAANLSLRMPLITFDAAASSRASTPSDGDAPAKDGHGSSGISSSPEGDDGLFAVELTPTSAPSVDVERHTPKLSADNGTCIADEVPLLPTGSDLSVHSNDPSSAQQQYVEISSTYQNLSSSANSAGGEEVWKRRAIAAEEENIQLRKDLHTCLIELAKKEGENTALTRQLDKMLERLTATK